jgi:hypothetical protein
MPQLEPVVTRYETRIEAMKTELKSLHSDPMVADKFIAGATNRLAPLPYSIDFVWEQRIQALANDPTRGFADQSLLKKAVEKLGETKIHERLQEWLVEADPFKERADEGAIARRGERLLESIENCFTISAERTDTRELQPDLVAMADMVRARMQSFVDGIPPHSPANSVPHKMYLELRDAIDHSIEGVRDRVRKAEEIRSGGDPDQAVADWDEGLAEKKEVIAKNFAKAPDFVWVRALREELPRSESQGMGGRKHLLETLFASRNLDGEMTALYKAIGNTDAANYVMTLREAAWPVHATIDHYLAGIDRVWGRGEEEVRDSFNQALCALADRLLKEVNFVIAAKLARSGPVNG